MAEYVYRRDESINRIPVPVEAAPYKPREPRAPKTEFSDQFDPVLCGTMPGYRQHRKFKQEQCDKCRKTNNEYHRKYQRGERKGKVR